MRPQLPCGVSPLRIIQTTRTELKKSSVSFPIILGQYSSDSSVRRVCFHKEWPIPIREGQLPMLINQLILQLLITHLTLLSPHPRNPAFCEFIKWFRGTGNTGDILPIPVYQSNELTHLFFEIGRGNCDPP